MARPNIRSKAERQTEVIVRRLIRHRAHALHIPISHRRLITCVKLKGADYRINKHEITVDLVFATTGNPLVMADKVLKAVENFDRRYHEDLAKQINEVKSRTLRHVAFLQRTLSPQAYHRFINSLHAGVVSVADLAPDPEPRPPEIKDERWERELPGENDFNYNAAALIAYGKMMQDKGIHFRV